jgi:hypothetical protein
MMALSIQQPWAWLIIRPDIISTRDRDAARLLDQFKDCENRNWNTHKRGLFYVHAGKKIDVPGLFRARSMFPDILFPKDYETGGIIGMARLTNCVTYHRSRFFVGPHGFLLADQKPVEFRAMNGKQGWFNVVHENGHAVSHDNGEGDFT